MAGQVVFNKLVVEKIDHASFRIKAPGVVVYIDPFRVKGSPRDADIVVCTHDHFDHCSVEDVKRVSKKDTVIVASINCSPKTEKLGLPAHLLKPGEAVEVKGVKITAVPAYNVDKPYHPRSYNGIGAVIEIHGTTIYHAGDTDYIPEMEQLRGKVDIALLPVSGTYVMDADEAAKAALAIEPKLAVPMHWGAIVGGRKDAERFKEKLAGKIRVEII